MFSVNNHAVITAFKLIMFAKCMHYVRRLLSSVVEEKDCADSYNVQVDTILFKAVTLDTGPRVVWIICQNIRINIT